MVLESLKGKSVQVQLVLQSVQQSQQSMFGQSQIRALVACTMRKKLWFSTRASRSMSLKVVVVLVLVVVVVVLVVLVTYSK